MKAVAESGPFPLNGLKAAAGGSQVRQGRAAAAQGTGRHRAAGERRGVRFLTFGAIGAAVFVAGLGIQIALVEYLHVDPIAAYITQSIISIELSFLVNRYLTRRDRSVSFFRTLWRFNARKALATVINLAAYVVIVRLGVQYIVANIALTAAFTPLNYVVAHYWSLEARARRATVAEQVPVHARHATTAGHLPDRARELLPSGPLPTVSAVIPCKNNPDTIRATVDALLLQDYPALEEITVIGDVDDPTWVALSDVADPRLSILEQEPTSDGREPNVKRDKGIRKSSGDLLAFVDSDIVMDADWLSWAVGMLLEQGGGLVAGGMRSITDTFWGRFVDRNVLAAKTPRLPQPYHVTAENFGKHGFKPPITANAVFTRQLYEACPLDVTWDYAYEDYDWFWRLTKSGYKILFSGRLTAAHHHRSSFRLLAHEYRRSARGCARFIRAHRECPLARKRLRQATLLPLAAMASLAGLVIAVRTGHLADVGVLLGAAAAFLVVREISIVRSVEAAVYPAAGLVLGVMFTGTLLSSLGQTAVTRERTQKDRERTQKHRLSFLTREPWPLLGILALQAGLSLRLVWSNTASTDEALYLWAGHLEWQHWLHGAVIPPFARYFSGSPVIYPPLGAVADSLGGLATARAMSMIFMLIATLLAYLTARRLLRDRTGAVYAAAVFALLGPTEALAYATYDALALMFMALAAWLAVRAADRFPDAWLLAAAIVMVLANATKYASALWDPAIAALAVAGSWDAGRRRRWLRAGRLGVYAAAIISAGLISSGRLGYIPGILGSTVTRIPSDNPPLAIFAAAYNYIGPVIVLSLLAVIGSWRAPARIRFLCRSVAVIAWLAPLWQAHIDTLTSLHKHVDFGAWFAAIGAGFVIAQASRLQRERSWREAVAITAVIPLALVAANVSGDVFRTWAPDTQMTRALRSLIRPGNARYLLADCNQVNYYLHAEVHPGQVSPLSGCNWQNPHYAQYSADIKDRQFQIITIDTDTVLPATNAWISRAIAASGSYTLVYRARERYHPQDFFEIWKLRT